MRLTRRGFHQIFMVAAAGASLSGATAVLECIASRMQRGRASLRFRVTLVAGWRASGATLLVHAATRLVQDATVTFQVSAGRGEWVRVDARHEGEGWLKAPLPRAVAAAVLGDGELALRWRQRGLRLDSRESVKFAPYLVVERAQ
ncbi:MAG: hypothetical protein R2729_31250 [Bryobacteraceae bacterium]